MKTIKIPSAINGTPGVYAENFSDPGFSIVSTTASFLVNVGSNPPKTLSSGQAVGAASGPALGRVEFSNTTASDIIVMLGDFTAARVTAVSASGGTFIGANSGLYDVGSSGGIVNLPGIDANGCERRIIYITHSGRTAVSGSASTSLVQVIIAPMGTVIYVFPGTVQPIETNANISLSSVNTDLSTTPLHLAATVLEIFYSKPLQTNQ